MKDENLHTYTVYKYTVSHLDVVRERVVLEKKCTRGNYKKKSAYVSYLYVQEMML